MEIGLIYFFSSLGTQDYVDQNHKTICEHSFFFRFLKQALCKNPQKDLAINDDSLWGTIDSFQNPWFNWQPS